MCTGQVLALAISKNLMIQLLPLLFLASFQLNRLIWVDCTMKMMTFPTENIPMSCTTLTMKGKSFISISTAVPVPNSTDMPNFHYTMAIKLDDDHFLRASTKITDGLDQAAIDALTPYTLQIWKHASATQSVELVTQINWSQKNCQN